MDQRIAYRFVQPYTVGVRFAKDDVQAAIVELHGFLLI
jgi:hypothetical protein